MVSDMRETVQTLDRLNGFNWQRDYGPLWAGSHDTAFWLEPGPDDVMHVNGVLATRREHEERAHRETLPRQYIVDYPQRRICNDCTRVALPGWRYCHQCYTARRNVQ